MKYLKLFEENTNNFVFVPFANDSNYNKKYDFYSASLSYYIDKPTYDYFDGVDNGSWTEFRNNIIKPRKTDHTIAPYSIIVENIYLSNSKNRIGCVSKSESEDEFYVFMNLLDAEQLLKIQKAFGSRFFPISYKKRLIGKYKTLDEAKKQLNAGYKNILIKIQELGLSLLDEKLPQIGDYVLLNHRIFEAVVRLNSLSGKTFSEYKIFIENNIGQIKNTNQFDHYEIKYENIPKDIEMLFQISKHNINDGRCYITCNEDYIKHFDKNKNNLDVILTSSKFGL